MESGIINVAFCDRCGERIDIDPARKIRSTIPPLPLEDVERILKDPKYKTVMRFCADCGREVGELVESGKLTICEIHALVAKMKGIQ